MVCAKSFFWHKKLQKGQNLVAQELVGAGAGALLVPDCIGGGFNLAGQDRDLTGNYKPDDRQVGRLSGPNELGDRKPLTGRERGNAIG